MVLAKSRPQKGSMDYVQVYLFPSVGNSLVVSTFPPREKTISGLSTEPHTYTLQNVRW